MSFGFVYIVYLILFTVSGLVFVSDIVYITRLFISEPLFMFFCLFYDSQAFLFAFSCLHFLAPIVCIHNCLLLVWTLSFSFLVCIHCIALFALSALDTVCIHYCLLLSLTLTFSTSACIYPFLYMYSIVYVSHSFKDCLHPLLFAFVTLTLSFSNFVCIYPFLCMYSIVYVSHSFKDCLQSSLFASMTLTLSHSRILFSLLCLHVYHFHTSLGFQNCLHPSLFASITLTLLLCLLSSLCLHV